jgi:Second Messenger Oligonucleotide or Dinucleotide Synthetase domain
MTLITPTRANLQLPDFTRSGFLSKLAEKLDMPERLDRLAREKYQEISDWLGGENSPLAPYSPKLYPQGSFRLGTIIRPISDADEFDIDLVCRLTFDKEQITQERLKKMIGDRLRQKYADNLEERRRCWTLYFDGFHIDILPALPNPEAVPNGILITDKELFRWQYSNPIDYSEWFKQRQIVRMELERSILAKAQGVDIAAVPEYSVRTPLQRAAQLLKRHRDGAFVDDSEDRPISIIITTLAAKAYDNEADLESTMQKLATNMAKYIETRDGVAWVANPTDENENFADKWQEHPQRKRKFIEWLGKLDIEMNSFAKSAGIQDLSVRLEKSFGRQLTNKVIQDFGETTKLARDQGALSMAQVTGHLGGAVTAATAASSVSRAAPVQVKPHQFYGED